MQTITTASEFKTPATVSRNNPQRIATAEGTGNQDGAGSTRLGEVGETVRGTDESSGNLCVRSPTEVSLLRRSISLPNISASPQDSLPTQEAEASPQEAKASHQEAEARPDRQLPLNRLRTEAGSTQRAESGAPTRGGHHQVRSTIISPHRITHSQAETDREQRAEREERPNVPAALSPLNINLKILDTGHSLLQELMHSPIFIQHRIFASINTIPDTVTPNTTQTSHATPSTSHSRPGLLPSFWLERRDTPTSSGSAILTQRTLFPIDVTRQENYLSPSQVTDTVESPAPTKRKGRSVTWALSSTHSHHRRRNTVDNAALAGTTLTRGRSLISQSTIPPRSAPTSPLWTMARGPALVTSSARTHSPDLAETYGIPHGTFSVRFLTSLPVTIECSLRIPCKVSLGHPSHLHNDKRVGTSCDFLIIGAACGVVQ